MSEKFIPKPAPQVHNLREIQNINSHAAQRIGPEQNSFKRFSMMVDEVMELHDALQQGDRKHIGQELADVFILLVSIADHYGLDMAEEWSKKVNRNSYKYPMLEFDKLVEQGMTYDEARKHLKNSWDRSLDDQF